MKTLIMAILGLVALDASAEVLSYTMGIDVNCPSGLTE